MTLIEFSALSDRGLSDRNDDTYCAEWIGDYFVLAVADGLAGHPDSGLASVTAIDALRETVKKTKGPPREVLLAGVRQADAAIRTLSESSPQRAGLATTLVACLIDKKMVCIVLDAGEKNCIIITKNSVRNAQSEALSRHPDQSGAEPYAAPPPPSLSEMISRVLGAPRRLKAADFSEFVLGDEFLLLSSDGLTDVLQQDAIADIVRKNRENPDVACEVLVQEAMKAGSESTITVVLSYRSAGT
jgi:protein phosphatase